MKTEKQVVVKHRVIRTVFVPYLVNHPEKIPIFMKNLIKVVRYKLRLPSVSSHNPEFCPHSPGCLWAPKCSRLHPRNLWHHRSNESRAFHTPTNLPFHLIRYSVFPFLVLLSKIFSTSYTSPSLPSSDIVYSKLSQL